MNPYSSAVRLNGNQNFLVGLCIRWNFHWVLKVQRADSYFIVRKWNLEQDCCFRGHHPGSFSRYLSQQEQQSNFEPILRFSFNEWQAMSVFFFSFFYKCDIFWLIVIVIPLGQIFCNPPVSLKVLVIQISFYITLCAVFCLCFTT